MGLKAVHMYFYFSIRLSAQRRQFPLRCPVPTLITYDGIADVKQPNILSSLRENVRSQAWKRMLLRISE